MYDIVRKRIVVLVLSLSILIILLSSIGLGAALAQTRNIEITTQFSNTTQPLPSQLLDRNGRLITEFFSVEKRELIPVEELPRHFIDALITREDILFFEHNGFSLRGFSRAVWNLVTGQYISGGSTLTQQLAGTLYADRSEFSISRKVRELWWAFQLERNFTKHEILEQYANIMGFGHGNYGVESASEFYFGHSARELSIAESVLLVIQLANHSLYSPIRQPNRAQTMQKRILDQMVSHEMLTDREALVSYNTYWDNYDFTRSNTSNAFFDREDKAPFFSEYIRYQLESELLLGSWDINKDGLKIYSSLDLDYQAEAERLMQLGLEKSNRLYKQNASRQSTDAQKMAPLINLLSLLYNVDELHVGTKVQEDVAKEYFQENVIEVIDLVSLLAGVSRDSDIRLLVDRTYQKTQNVEKKTDVEGALIVLDNDNGYVLAMVGGSNFETRNQFNRATDSLIEPGSSFKPLYYSAGIENKIITPATLIYDSPVIFWNDDGTAYEPKNFKDEWVGPVLVRYALANSMNVPSLKILERIGFDAVIGTTSRLLGIPNSEFAKRNFTRNYPIGLGVVAVAPIEMASAYSAFARAGSPVTPVSVRYVEDRKGNIIINPENTILKESESQTPVISPRAAYIMTSMLKTTVEEGTLRYPESLVGGFDHPMAGKTGTTQNWSDAWTVGFSPYMTTAVWIGFDKGGSNSLGTNQTGAVTTGPIWARIMKYMHRNLPPRDFIRPTGLVNSWVTADRGLLPPTNYDDRVINEIFISGTEPRVFDESVEETFAAQEEMIQKLREHFDDPFGLNDNLFETNDSFGIIPNSSDPTLETFSTEGGNESEELLNPILFNESNPLLE